MDKPTIAQKSPYVMDMKPSTVFFCTCGNSDNQPFCNGAHKGSGFTPTKVDIMEEKKVAFCGCKHSGNGAFCDGSHNRV